jgi:hypothetical protein
MDRYAHTDQVCSLVSRLRDRVFELIDVPGTPDSVFDAVMAEFDGAENRYVVWTFEDEIALDYLESLDDE